MILVTGGTGFIGSHTCVELIQSGREVVIIDNLSNSKIEVLDSIQKITGIKPFFYQVDINDKQGLIEVFTKHKIDAVVHFAGLKAVGESCAIPLKYYSNNISGTLVLLSVMEKFGCKKIVFSSSATVYGENNLPPFTEDMPTSATNPYGWTKQMQEQIFSDIALADKDMCVALLRQFNPIGAHPSGEIGEHPNGIPNNLVPYICRVAVGQLPFLNVFGNDYPTVDGTGVRDYIHVVDLAKAHLCALERAEKVTGIEYFNIGTGTGYSVLDVVKAYEAATGAKVNYKIGPRRPGDIDECYANPEKAYTVLGWKAQYNLTDMCKDSYNWQSKNPNGYEE